jgi:hypothetical protein
MITDKEKVLALFKELGIGAYTYENSIVCTQGEEKIGGYRGFSCNFNFTEEGKFIEVDIYE